MKFIFTRKTKLLLLLLFMIGYNLNAQETFDVPLPASFENLSCTGPTIGFSQVIQCQSSSTFYAQLIFRGDPPSNLMVAYTIGNVQYTANVEDGELIIMDLPVGVDITVTGINDCNQPYELITFNTSLQSVPTEQIVVSQEMAHLLNGWGNSNEETVPPSSDEAATIYESVLNTERVSKYEKIAFVQQFYYHFNPIPDEYCGDVPPPPPPPPEVTCICNWIISSNTSGFPVSLNATTGGFNEIARSIVIDDGNDVDGGLWEGNAGPAHGTFHYLDAWKKHKNVFHEVTAGDLFTPGTTDTELSSSYARIYYKLLCEGITIPPEDCNCEKTLTVGWHYNAYLSAESKLLGSSGNRSSRARIDEMAIVLAEVQGEDAQILDHGSASARSACDIDLNNNILTSAGNILSGAAMLAIGGWSALGGVGSIATTTMNSTQGTETTTTTTEGTSTVVTTPNNSINLNASNGSLISNGVVMLTSGIAGIIGGFTEGLWEGTCENETGSAVLVDGSQQFILEPNHGVEITLSSFTSSAVGGKWKYQSKAFAASEFFLGVKIPENIQTIESDCCSPAVASYISSSWRDAPGLPEYNNLQYLTEVTQFFSQEPVWALSNFTIAREWSNVIGPAPTVCQDNTVIIQALNTPSNDNIFANAKVTLNSDGLNIANLRNEAHHKNSSSINYQLYDINGRLIYSGEVYSFDNELFISNTELYGNFNKPEKGIYFLRLFSGNNHQVLKLVL